MNYFLDRGSTLTLSWTQDIVLALAAGFKKSTFVRTGLTLSPPFPFHAEAVVPLKTFHEEGKCT